MAPDSIVWALLPLTGIALLIVGLNLRRLRRTYVTDYQQGVQFDNGTYSKLLGPGSHFSRGKSVHVEIVDMRPMQFVMECVAYRDALRNDSSISVGGEIVVDEPYLAATRLKDRFADSMPKVRDTLRLIASRAISDGSAASRERLASEVAATVNAELGAAGMKIASLEITEMWSRPVVGRIAKGLN
jgi:hypothetical protein